MVVNVHVQPRAGGTRITGRHGNALKIRVAAPPVGGRATEAARVELATAFGVAANDVSLSAGERSRAKRFLVAGVSLADCIARVRALLATEAG